MDSYAWVHYSTTTGNRTNHLSASNDIVAMIKRCCKKCGPSVHFVYDVHMR